MSEAIVKPAAALPSRSSSRSGLTYALLAFGLWGLFPLYFHALAKVPSFEVLCYRIIGAAVLLAGWAVWHGRLGLLLAEFRQPRRLAFYAATTVLVSLNWWLYIWAVQCGRVMEASLGYFINPLVNVILGVLFLRERLNGRQWLAIAIAAAGVLWLVVSTGVTPWVSLSLALTFGSYGLIRKMGGFDAVIGLTVETLILAPFALFAVGRWLMLGQSSIGALGGMVDGLLLLAGLVTVIPLVLFLEAGLRLKLATLGIVQYLTPTMQFLLALLLFHEPFDQARGITFVCIWVALVIYTVDAIRLHRLTPIEAEAE